MDFQTCRLLLLVSAPFVAGGVLMNQGPSARMAFGVAWLFVAVCEFASEARSAWARRQAVKAKAAKQPRPPQGGSGTAPPTGWMKGVV